MDKNGLELARLVINQDELTGGHPTDKAGNDLPAAWAVQGEQGNDGPTSMNQPMGRLTSQAKLGCSAGF